MANIRRGQRKTLLHNRRRGLKKTILEFSKYGVVGLLNFLTSILIYYFLINVIKLRYEISFSLIWIYSILFTYLINFAWVFKPGEKFIFKKYFVKYIVVYFISYLANIFSLKLLVDQFNYDPFWCQFAIIPLVVVINFFGFKHWGLK